MIKRIVTLFSIVFLAWTLQASAHAEIIHSTPKHGQTVQSPIHSIQLTFGERVEKFLSIKLTNAQGESINIGKPEIKGKNVSIPVSQSLQPGTYTLKWKVMSIDGHAMSQRLSFNYKSKSKSNATTKNNKISKKNQEMINNQQIPVIVMFVIGAILIIGTGIFFAGKNKRNK